MRRPGGSGAGGARPSGVRGGARVDAGVVARPPDARWGGLAPGRLVCRGRPGASHEPAMRRPCAGCASSRGGGDCIYWCRSMADADRFNARKVDRARRLRLPTLSAAWPGLAPISSSGSSAGRRGPPDPSHEYVVTSGSPCRLDPRADHLRELRARWRGPGTARGDGDRRRKIAPSKHADRRGAEVERATSSLPWNASSNRRRSPEMRAHAGDDAGLRPDTGSSARRARHMLAPISCSSSRRRLPRRRS